MTRALCCGPEATHSTSMEKTGAPGATSTMIGGGGSVPRGLPAGELGRLCENAQELPLAQRPCMWNLHGACVLELGERAVGEDVADTAGEDGVASNGKTVAE